MAQPINNIEDLRAEIARLKGVEQEQSVALAQRVNTPSALFSTLFSLFPKSSPEGEKGSGFFDQDFVGLISRIVLPILLNKTIFRKSNFIIKTIVSILSQRASHFINEETISTLWGIIKSLFKGKDDEIPEHRAIPALSETA